MLKVGDKIKTLTEVTMLDAYFNPVVVARAGDIGTVTQITSGSMAEQHGNPFMVKFENEGKLILIATGKFASKYEVVENGR